MSHRPSTSYPKNGGILSTIDRILDTVVVDKEGEESEAKAKAPTDVIAYSGKAVNDEIDYTYKVSQRVEDLVLHCPREGVKRQSKYPPYNIILHRPTSADPKAPRISHSLFRSDSESEATWMFRIYIRTIPDLVKASSVPLENPALESFVKLANQYESYTAVHVAAALNMVDLLRSPILKGKMVANGGRRYRTPLAVACVNGKFEAFKTILEIDEENMIKHFQHPVDKQGNTILHLVAVSEDKEVGIKMLKLIKRKILQEYGEGTEYQWDDLLVLIFQKQNAKGLAPIHLACIGQNLEMVELLSTCVNPAVLQFPTASQSQTLVNIRADSNGYTPLHFSTNSPWILSRLLSLGANPNIPDNDGLTPLHKAVLMRHWKSTLRLLDSNADPNCKAASEKYSNVTPLHLASGICDVDAMKALLVFGANKSLVDKHGNTPKHMVELVFEGTQSLKQEALAVLNVDLADLEATKEKMKEMFRNMAAADGVDVQYKNGNYPTNK